MKSNSLYQNPILKVTRHSDTKQPSFRKRKLGHPHRPGGREHPIKPFLPIGVVVRRLWDTFLDAPLRFRRTSLCSAVLHESQHCERTNGDPAKSHSTTQQPHKISPELNRFRTPDTSVDLLHAHGRDFSPLFTEKSAPKLGRELLLLWILVRRLVVRSLILYRVQMVSESEPPWWKRTPAVHGAQVAVFNYLKWQFGFWLY